MNGCELLQPSMATVNAFDFDNRYPFTNIFWADSPARYNFPVIGFCGSYKQIEEDWNEWLWKFGQFLSALDAIEACVNLHCILGSYQWHLEPELLHRQPTSRGSTKGQKWGVIAAPENDFSVHPTWLAHCETKWTQFVERWTDNEAT